MRALYGEEFDFSSLVTRLAVPDDNIHRLRAFVAIRVATELREPLADTDIAQVTNELSLLEPHHDKEGFQNLLETLRQLAEIQWMRRQTYILKGHVAYQEDEDSYEALQYIAEKNNGGPVGEKQRKLALEIADLTRQIRHEELKAWKEHDYVEYVRLKNEIETRELRKEVEKQEELEDNLEFESIRSMLAAKVTALTGNWISSSEALP